MKEFNGQSKDILQNNIDNLKHLFPEVFTEDKIDFERLCDVLGDFVDDRDERYRFEWNGKSQALRMAQTMSTGTLRPCRTESKDWDTTENLYIEGDNLEVLKLLQKSYHNSIKMIYIDPPYNTGKDFVYPDNYRDNMKNYLELTGQVDGENKKISTNSETSGRYHTDWLNMMYPRLRLARNLLTDDGVIFISIGENELSNIIKMCDELLGESNRLSIIGRVMKTASNNGTFFAPSLDYILCYAKNINYTQKLYDEVNDKLYKKVEVSGLRKGDRYRDDVAFYQSSQKDLRPNQKYFVECPDGSKVIPPCSIQDEIMRAGDGRWRWSKEKYLKDKHLLVFKMTKSSPLVDANGDKSKYNIYTKSYLKDRQESGVLPRNIWTDFINRKGADLLRKMNIPFDFSKPVELIEYILKIMKLEEGIVLDFFSGSATTAHSIMKYNSYSNSKIKSIMVQLPEPIDKDGYKNICEIGKERIRRAGDKIKNEIQGQQLKIGEEPKEVPDVGFKVFKLDSSNLKKWNPDYDNFEYSITNMTENFVPDRTEEDVLYEIMLKYGIDLTLPMETHDVNGKKVFDIGFCALFICLDDDIDMSVANFIITKKEEIQPEITRVVFKDNGFTDDSTKTNVEMKLERAGFDDVVSV